MRSAKIVGQTRVQAGTRSGHEREGEAHIKPDPSGCHAMRARSASRGGAALGGPGTCAAWAPAGVGTDGTGRNRAASDREGCEKAVTSPFIAATSPRSGASAKSGTGCHEPKKREEGRLDRPAVYG